MPVFLIEDTETGFALAAEGEVPPTQDDAHELILSTLRTNLYEYPGNRFLLDVGPLSQRRREIDRPYLSDYPHLVENAMLMELPLPYNPDGTLNRDEYERTLKRVYKEQESKLLATPATQRDTKTATMLSRLPEHTLLLDSHGDTEGFLSMDENAVGSKHRYTLQAVAHALGDKKNSIHNFFNSACYAGLCPPEVYDDAFPNLTNIVQTAGTNANYGSVGKMNAGEFWRKDVGKSRWIKRDGKWVLSPADAPDDWDVDGVPVEFPLLNP